VQFLPCIVVAAVVFLLYLLLCVQCLACNLQLSCKVRVLLLFSFLVIGIFLEFAQMHCEKAV